jgi:succinate dehydrogenase / fumarate reductase, cytochrome b subunit
MSVANRPVHRPLSPHLQVYKPQLTSVMSILHRATGIALSVGALYLVIWVVFASASPGTYAKFQAFNVSILGRIFLGGWLFCGFYHLCNGIRHLVQDAGLGYEIPQFIRSSWLSVVGSIVLTVLVWAYVWMAGGAA